MHEDAGSGDSVSAVRTALPLRCAKKKSPPLAECKQCLPSSAEGPATGAGAAIEGGVHASGAGAVPRIREFPEGPEGDICRLIQGNPQHIDDICRALGQNVNSVSRCLLLLELQGRIRRLPGMVYSLADN
ncbi:hypothetical protein LJC23_06065 [Desulfovibrio sp. OttesenSCG-928-I05]|nr:hypothetical protein [Desulfovibrio sp. OttesenSCG-928-I05]